MLKNIPPDSCGALEYSPLAKSLPKPRSLSSLTYDAEVPPMLGGRLTPVRQSNQRYFDLFWKERADGKPSFRWQPDDQRLLILAAPNEQNVRTLFDCAAEKGIGMPQIQITGSPEFQRIAAIEAARRGLPVDTSKLDPSAAELYRSTFSREHGESANAISVSAYESQRNDEQRRAAEAEAARAKESDAPKKDASANQQMRG